MKLTLLLDHVNKRPFAYLTYLMKVRDFKIANYKTINVWDQEYNKDVVSPQGFRIAFLTDFKTFITTPRISKF